MREYRNASGGLTFDLADSCDEFFMFVDHMIQLYGKPVQELYDAVGDDRYWDFKVEDMIVVLHGNCMLGVSIFVLGGTHEDLLRDIANKLTTDNGNKTGENGRLPSPS
ncbi:MAG TPA: hypothetical protein DCM28_19370 [Phycisphaerales bacterium]|nr:hypothetical protein [Phycisphaerales bacterium]HCD34467.1 hypothetical protein [Phycisphaerales bacterium]|tara:strand:+ start:363 stop:686 length:324 start_codon:yes stop_codon:yes gene_type:complete